MALWVMWQESTRDTRDVCFQSRQILSLQDKQFSWEIFLKDFSVWSTGFGHAVARGPWLVNCRDWLGLSIPYPGKGKSYIFLPYFSYFFSQTSFYEISVQSDVYVAMFDQFGIAESCKKQENSHFNTTPRTFWIKRCIIQHGMEFMCGYDNQSTSKVQWQCSCKKWCGKPTPCTIVNIRYPATRMRTCYGCSH